MRHEVHSQHDSWKLQSNSEFLRLDVDKMASDINAEEVCGCPCQEAHAASLAEGQDDVPSAGGTDAVNDAVVPEEVQSVGNDPDDLEESTEASEQVLKEDCEYYHIGEEELKSSACADALALLLDHADEAVRMAAQQAISMAKEPKEEPKQEPKQEEVDGFVSLSSGDLSSDEDWEQFEEWQQVTMPTQE